MRELASRGSRQSAVVVTWTQQWGQSSFIKRSERSSEQAKPSDLNQTLKLVYFQNFLYTMLKDPTKS